MKTVHVVQEAVPGLRRGRFDVLSIGAISNQLSRNSESVPHLFENLDFGPFERFCVVEPAWCVTASKAALEERRCMRPYSGRGHCSGLGPGRGTDVTTDKKMLDRTTQLMTPIFLWAFDGAIDNAITDKTPTHSAFALQRETRVRSRRASPSRFHVRERLPELKRVSTS